MHETLLSIQKQLEAVIEQLNTKIPNDEPFGLAHKNWSFPGLTRAELAEEAQSIIDLIEDRGGEELGENESRIIDYTRRLTHLQSQTVAQMWGNAGQAVPAFMFTLQGLRRALSTALTKDAQADVSSRLRTLTRQVRAMESRIKEVEPRAASLETMVERIEDAYNAADQLPTDLESLKEARSKIAELVKEATRDRDDIATFRGSASDLEQNILDVSIDADKVLKKCESAYSAATSVGLAAAFAERSAELAGSIKFWVTGLIVALGIGGFFGAFQLQKLTALLADENTATPVFIFHLSLALISVGGPIWFSWLATKQIGQRFRLSEDYAFKASVSRAYEGYRREAARVDKDMETKLLSSALTRLDELPLRWVEKESHGSPLHEIVNSAVVQQAMKSVPGFAAQVKEMASNAVTGFSNFKSSPPPESKRKAKAEEEDPA